MKTEVKFENETYYETQARISDIFLCQKSVDEDYGNALCNGLSGNGRVLLHEYGGHRCPRVIGIGLWVLCPLLVGNACAFFGFHI